MKRILLPLAFVALLGSSNFVVARAQGVAAPGAERPLPLIPLGSDGEYALVEVGARAPDFSYETLAGSKARLRDLRSQGHVLLVFGPSEPQLRRLARERERLTRLGVVPVAILDWRAGECREIVRRLSLAFPVVSDPRRTIGAQYNTLDPRTRHGAPAWFAIDRTGHVRGLARFEFPREPWSEVVASALGLPLGDVPLPASQEAK